MDPNATLRIWAESEIGSDEREEAFENLLSWIERGGFAPDRGSTEQAWASFLETAYEREMA